MLQTILTALYFIFPAYVANMAPVFAKALNLPLGKPIHTELFGENKTWRGGYSAYLFAFGIASLQIFFFQKNFFTSVSYLSYTDWNPFLLAFLFGIGALFGDLVKSFFKRRLKIKSGAPWPPFDQLDFILGVLLFFAFFKPIPWNITIVLIIITPLLHLLSNIMAYFLGLKKIWW